VALNEKRIKGENNDKRYVEEFGIFGEEFKDEQKSFGE
jgi:hypothetical protein